MPDFNDLNKLGSGKDMVERLTNLIASSRTQPSTSHKIEPMVMTSSATPMNTLCAYDVAVDPNRAEFENNESGVGD